jgi:cytochrome c
MPHGAGLPAGMGSARRGRTVYELKCASCHGKNGSEGPFVPLVGVMGDTGRAKTIGNYWPYSTTIFDYIRRAMPYNKPGSLTNDEVYALTAFLLYKNRVIDSAFVVTAITLPKITMPARKFFVGDDRRGGPEVR